MSGSNTSSENPANTVVAGPAIPLWPGLAAHAGDYDGYLLDLWGTVHDGIQPLPGVLDCTARLRAAGKRILILSNAPRRNKDVVTRMRRIGVPDDAWDAILSSGEAVWRALDERADAWHRALGRKCYLVGGAGDDSAVAGLGFDIVDDAATADFVVAIGIDTAGDRLEKFEPMLAAAAARKLPMVCANPDLEVLRGEARELCAGAMAARYEDLGGEVVFHGKPHAPIYDLALELLGVSERGRVLAVGDSLRTDIAGAVAAGIDSLFITGGIHAEALGVAPDDAPDADRLGEFCAAAGWRPTAYMPRLVW